jgi:tetratricopeptide (TPR) repeat protein
VAEKTDELLAKAVPKIAAQGKLDSLKKKMARFAARAWVKGPEKLAALGVQIPKKAHAAALDAAEASEEDDEGAFLDDIRKALRDDEAFVVAAKALAKAYLAALQKRKSGAEDKPLKKRASSRRQKIVVEEEKPPQAVSEHDDDEEELPTLEIPDEEAPKPLGIRMEDDAPAPAKLKKKERGEVNRIELAEEAGDLEIMPVMVGPEAAAKAAGPKEIDKDEGPDAAAARSLERYRKDGDPDELANARKLYKVAVEKAPKGPARAAARAGVGLCSLLGGNNEEALKYAEKALEEDPLCAMAISVQARARRKEGQREKLKAAIARARSAVKSGDLKRANKAAQEIDEEFPGEPAGKLIGIALAAEGGVVEDAIKEAWKVYPSAKHPDLPLGEPLDTRVARVAASWGAQEVERGGPDALVQTQRKLDEKDNLLAGAFQIALGVARTALATRTDLTKNEDQELRAACGDGLLGLQYFDAGAAAFDKGFAIDRNSGVAMECKKGAEKCAVMRRAFDKPGVKAKLGSFDGVGTAALKKATGARVAEATTAKETEEQGLLKDELAAVKALIADAARRKKVEERAKKGDKENPLAPLLAVEKEVKDLTDAKSAVASKEPEKKGFFGRAFDKVKDTAKTAKLAVQKQMAESKLAEAHKAVARKLRDAPDGGWGDPVLDALAKRGSAVEARLEHYEDELLQAKKVVARIAEL